MQHTHTRVRWGHVPCVFPQQWSWECQLLAVSAQSGLCYEAGERSEGPLHSFLLASPLTNNRHTTDHVWVKGCFLKYLFQVLGLFYPMGIVGHTLFNNAMSARILWRYHGSIWGLSEAIFLLTDTLTRLVQLDLAVCSEPRPTRPYSKNPLFPPRCSFNTLQYMVWQLSQAYSEMYVAGLKKEHNKLCWASKMFSTGFFHLESAFDQVDNEIIRL